MKISVLMSKFIFSKHLPLARPKLLPKLKVPRIYWNLVQINPKIKHAQNFFKFDPFDISKMATLILMSKIIFIKYLPSIRFKLIIKSKMLRINWNLAHLIFKYTNFSFNGFYGILTNCKAKITLRLKLISNSFWYFKYFNLPIMIFAKIFRHSIIFDIKIEIDIFEMSHMSNFNKFLAFLVLGPI